MNADLTDKNVLELSDLFKVKKKSDYQFPRLSHTMGFVAFSRTVGNL